jgi:hypothetical protein
MGAFELVVPVAGEGECRDGLDPAAEQPQDVERCLVGPVHVLDDEDRRCPASKLARKRCGHFVRPGVTPNVLLELAARELGNFEKGTERTRREERFAAPPQNSHRAVLVVAEAPQKCRLADARLSSDEHDPSASFRSDGREAVVEHGELARPFEQVARRLSRADRS